MLSPSLRFLIAGIVSFILYTGAVVIVFQAKPHHEVATSILLLCFLCTTFLVVLRALEPAQSLPTMFCMFYFSFFYLLPGTVQVSSNTFQMADVTYSDPVATKGALIAAVFLAFFFIGQHLVSDRHYSAAAKAIEESEKNSRFLPIVCFGLLAVALSLFSIHKFGLHVLLSTRGEFRESVLDNLGTTSTEVGLLLNLPRALSLVGVLALAYGIGRWRHEKPSLNAIVAVPLLLALIPIFCLINYPPALARNWQFGILLSFLVVFVRGWRPWLRAGLVFGMLLAMFSLFQWLNVLRNYDKAGSVAESVVDPISYLKQMDFDGYQTTMNTVIHTRIHDHTYGKQILASLLFPIPRAVWHDKGEATGVMVGRDIGYDMTNLSTPMPAELYIDFSFAGIMLGGLFFGYFYRRLDYICAAAVDYGRMNLHLIMVAILTAYTIFIMRGSLYAVINIFGPIAILGFLVLKAPLLARMFISGPSNRGLPPLQTPAQPPLQTP